MEGVLSPELSQRGWIGTMSPRKIGVTEVALRDAHQSLMATRMAMEDMVDACADIDAAGYWSVECWGGATFDSCIRFLNEDPWVRLRTFRELMPNSRLQMLLRGQNLLGYRHYEDTVVEEFVEGTELSVTVIEDDTGLRALPPVEIRPASGVYDYESRYTAGATRFLTPGELPDDVLEAAGDLAVRTHRVLGHRDLSRIDMIVRDGVPVFLESNVAPGLTDTSLTPLALDAAGLGMGEVFSALVEQARRRGH